MTPLSREAMDRLGVRFATPAPETKTSRPKDSPAWLVACLKTFTKGEDITAEIVAERTGRTLKHCRAVVSLAVGARWLRRVNDTGGAPAVIWERTGKPWAKPDGVREWGQVREKIAKMEPGRRFIRAYLCGAPASTNRAMAAAIAGGIVVEVGVVPSPRGVYRRVA